MRGSFAPAQALATAALLSACHGAAPEPEGRSRSSPATSSAEPTSPEAPRVGVVRHVHVAAPASERRIGDGPTRVAASADTIFWLDVSSDKTSLRAAPKGGGPAKDIAAFDRGPTDLAVHDGAVYVVSKEVLYRIDVATGERTQIMEHVDRADAPPDRFVFSSPIDRGNPPAGSRIFAMERSGPVELTQTKGFLRALAVGAAGIAWAEPLAVLVLPTGAATPISRGAISMDAVAFGGDRLFFVQSGLANVAEGKVGFAPASSNEAGQLFATAQAHPTSVVVCDGRVYWSNYGITESNDPHENKFLSGAIMSASLDGTDVRVVAASQAGAAHLSTDGESIYWVDMEADSVEALRVR